MKNSPTRLNNQGGQIIVEAVLLLAVMVSLSILVTKQLRKSNFAQGLITTPWEKMSGMVECGSWGKCGPGLHPSSISRVVSWLPEDQL